MNLVTRLFVFPKSQTLKFNSGATALTLCQSEPGTPAPRQGPSTCPQCAGPRAHSLCRCRSRRGGDREAPPWGRSKWSGRKSLGRCAPAAASEPHTWQRPGSASSRTKKGRTGAGGRRAVPAAAKRELLELGHLSCPRFPGRSPAPCRPRPGAGSLPPQCQ